MRIPALLSAAALAAAIGCGGGEPAEQPRPEADPRSATEYDQDHHDHGYMVALGETEIEGLTVRVKGTRLERPGQDLAFDVDFLPAASSPDRVVLWIGTGQERATEIVELDVMGPGQFHEHVDAPHPWDDSYELHVEFDHFLLGLATATFPISVKWEADTQEGAAE